MPLKDQNRVACRDRLPPDSDVAIEPLTVGNEHDRIVRVSPHRVCGQYAVTADDPPCGTQMAYRGGRVIGFVVGKL